MAPSMIPSVPSSLASGYNKLKGMWSYVSLRKKRKVLMVGLDTGGKTTILYNLKFGAMGPRIPTVATIGYNTEKIKHKNFSFSIWDVGGQQQVRKLWSFFCTGLDALIFVVDSSDRDRILEARRELHRLIAEQGLDETALLVLANKQDLPNAMTAVEIEEEFGLQNMGNRQWYLQATCAMNGEGLWDGLDWLSRALTMQQAVARK